MKKHTKTILSIFLALVMMLALSIPVFTDSYPPAAPEWAAAAEREYTPPTDSSEAPLPSGVVQATVNGTTALYWTDDNTGSLVYIRAELPLTATEYELRHATVVIEVTDPGVSVSGTGITFTGTGTTRTASNVNLFNKAYPVQIDSVGHILAAGFVDGRIGISANDPVGIFNVTINTADAEVYGSNVTNNYMGNLYWTQVGEKWIFVKYYVTASIPTPADWGAVPGVMDLSSGDAYATGCTTGSGPNFSFNLNTARVPAFTIHNSLLNREASRIYYMAVVGPGLVVVTPDGYHIDLTELKEDAGYPHNPNMEDQVEEIEEAIAAYFASPRSFPAGSSVMDVLEDFIDWAEANNRFTYDSDTGGGFYLSELNGLAVGDTGTSLDGWMYTDEEEGWSPTCSVPMIGAADYILHSSDVITWFFTTDYNNHF